MLKYIPAVALLIAAVIHLLPITGVAGGARLTTLYGLDFSDPSLQILMRHRAVLLGLLGAYLAFAAFVPAHRTVAFTAGFVSVLAFLALSFASGNYNPAITRVVAADLVALVALVAGVAVHMSRGAD